MTRLRNHSFIRGLFSLLLPLLVLLSLAGMAMAAGEEGGHPEFEPILSMAMLWRTVNFVILFAVLYKFIAKPMRDFFANRREGIISSLEEAKQAKEDAERRYQDLSGRLANRDQEFEEIRRSALENAEKTKNQIIAEAHEKAKRMEEKARESIEQELKKARECLKQEAAELALKLSEERLKKEITPSDHIRFVNEYIADLKQ
jgi:F-type H+-transporting ATPase subunit b